MHIIFNINIGTINDQKETNILTQEYENHNLDCIFDF